MPRATKASHGPEAESPKGTLNDRRWQEVLDAAEALFEQRGYQATTLQDVASRVQLLAPSLYYYIKTKEDLLFSVMKRAHEVGLALIDEAERLDGSDAETRLVTFIRHWMGHTFPPPVRIIERDIRFLSADRQAQVVELRDRVNHFVVRIIKQGIDEGAFDPTVDPGVAASTLFVVLNGIGSWFRESGRVSYAELTDWYAKLFVGGLRSGPTDRA